MTTLTFSRAKAESALARRARWPLAVIGLGLSASVLWTSFLGYWLYYAATRLFD